MTISTSPLAKDPTNLWLKSTSQQKEKLPSNLSCLYQNQVHMICSRTTERKLMELRYGFLAHLKRDKCKGVVIPFVFEFVDLAC